MADERNRGRSDNPPAAGPAVGNTAFTGMPAQLGRYRIKKRLGGGGMGAVYLVENTELQRDEALKVPHFESGSDPAVRERFLREARAAARLHHPNLCPIYHADVIDGICFLTMCYLEGKPLSAYTGRPHPPRAALKIVVKLAEALEHAHSKGVIHRDLKPGNIMMCPGTGPTVLDFGLAKQTRQQDHKLTQTGATLGTPAYMPPEQVKCELDRIGPASDVYSLGVILFELLTGRLPFEGAVGEVMAKVLFTEAPLPSQVLPRLNPALDAVCRRAMAKEPEKRYPSMKAFAAALVGLLRSLPAQTETATGSDALANTDELCDAPTMIPTANVAATAEVVIRPTRDRGRARGTQRRRSREPGRQAWLVGLLGLAMVVAVVSVVAVVMKLASRHDQRTEAPAKRSSDNPKETAPPSTGKQETKDGGDIADSFMNDFGMKLVRIPGGTFKMGAPTVEMGNGDDERQHEVGVSPFHLGVYEVTQGQFRKVMGYNPSYFSTSASGRDGVIYGVRNPGSGKHKIPVGEDTDDYPVDNVSWEEAKEFCQKLTISDKKTPDGWSYRLPTEAEWEYACRGNAPSYRVFHVGNSISSHEANFDGNSPYGGAEKGPYLERTCKVGSYRPNRFGLYDMHGNVWEWCADWYDKDYYHKSLWKDPQGPLTGSDRVFRGGSWYHNGQSCRSANRHRDWPTDRDNYIGFRVALVPAGR
jgi:formylglycine-generating enzyme required for sulfatase activity